MRLLLLSSILLLGAPAWAQAQGGARPFAHFNVGTATSSRHVPRTWLRESEGEVPRDCRGCHVFTSPSAGGAGPTPAQLCQRCHYGGSLDVQDLGANLHEREWRGGDAPSPQGFSHWRHLNLECARCHRPPAGRFGVAAGADDMRTPVGSGWCMACHDPARGQGPAAAPTVVAGFVDVLNRSLSMATLEPEGFRHRDHLAEGQLTDPQACTPCHAPLLRARDSRTLPHSFDPEACAPCHRRAPGDRQPFFATVPWQSRASATFLHAKHLQEKACVSCHPFDPELGTFQTVGAATPGGGPVTLYPTCVRAGCHPDRAVDPAEYEHGAARTVTGTEILCELCHAEAPASGPLTVELMRTNRPVVAVTREVIGHPYELRLHGHPGITGTVRDPCSRCHLADLESLESRHGSRQFSHIPHLSTDTPYQVDDCLPCHEGLARSTGSEQLQRLVDQASCPTCHVGQSDALSERDAVEERQVLRFPHGKHVGVQVTLDGAPRALPCQHCHAITEPDPAAASELPREIAVWGPDQGARCSECHGHELTAQRQRSGGLGLTSVRGCVGCHFSGIPAADSAGPPVIPDSVQEIRGLVPGARQHHPMPVDQACAECHRVSVGTLVQREADHVLGRQLHPAHQNGVTPKGANGQLQDCLDCHWADPPRSVRGISDPGGLPFQRWQQSHARRATLGASLGGYPGGGSR
jgi:hypothetical protein